MEAIRGYVEHIVYRNSENGYTVLKLSAGEEEITCVGTLPFIGEGDLLEASGSYTVHASYGEQFQIRSFEIREPEDKVAIERYLASGAIKGIKAGLAGRIVRRFGEDTFRIMEQEPERLAEVKGISDRKAREIAAQVEEKRDVREAFLFLSHYGVSNTMAMRIYQIYGKEIYRIIRENPYQLADEVTGIGFRTADEIARRAGTLVDSGFRIESGICYVLNQAAGEGHIYLPMDRLIARAEALLELRIEEPMLHLTNLLARKKIVIKSSQNVYLASLYHLELHTAQMLSDLNVTSKPREEEVLRKIRRIEVREGQDLDERQREAVMEAVRCGLMILTGGPGTGKTTTINTMISYFREEGRNIALAAPTGRAAKRMTEATKFEAKTIHRLLEVEGGPEDKDQPNNSYAPAYTGEQDRFGRNSQKPLDEDVIIVDEMSMVDIYLMHALLSAITPGTRLIMVGDPSQLPSVGPGCVLKDMVASGRIRVVTLTKIFRQAEQSDIVVNAHRINRGEHPALDNKSRDFFFLQRSDADRIIRNTIELITMKLPKYVNAQSFELQVLTPTRKGVLGVEQLNRILQKYLNPPEPGKTEYTGDDRLLREGDKVMQIRNNYQLKWEIRGRHGVPVKEGTGVFNGDIGVIDCINVFEEKVTVCFDEERYVEYEYKQLAELELAYAVTVHKSQGSEYPAVIMPLLEGPRMLLNRNLLYTAVTRAKSCVVILGDPGVFYRMIDNTQQLHRCTSLRERLVELGE